MVQEEGVPVREALRRLGAPIRECPACTVDFQVKRLPRFWIHEYIDGVLVGGDPKRPDLLFCSRHCAESYAEELRDEHPNEHNPQTGHLAEIKYVVHREGS